MDDHRKQAAVPPRQHRGEFAPGIVEPPEIPVGEISRRRFLTLVGASAALATTGTACSEIDRGTIVPYTRKPEEVIPGVATYYASTFPDGLIAQGVLVKTREGRPIHIEGNDEHPYARGKASLRAVADVLRLYDPDRLRQPVIDGKAATWRDAEARVHAALREARSSNREVWLVTGAVLSPTRRALIADLKTVLPRLVHLPVEPVAPQAERLAAEEVFGEYRSPRLRFDRADVVLSFQHDFLGSDGDTVNATRDFAAGRRVRARGDRMSRLWVCEGGMSLTGTNADERIAIRPRHAAVLAFALAGYLNRKHDIPLPPGVSPTTLSDFDLDRLATELHVPAEHLHALARDLAGARERAVVLAGPAVPSEAHVAAHLLNVMLAAEGNTVDTAFAAPPPRLLTVGELREQFKAAARRPPGAAAAAIFWDVNPAYCFPDAAVWRSFVKSVPLRVRLGLHMDETARDCQVVLAEHHWLEAWGDYEPSADMLSLQQPAVGPLYDSRQGEDVLLAMVRSLNGTAAADYHEYLKERWHSEVYSGGPVPFERFWNAALHDGVLRRKANPRPARRFRAAAVARAARTAAQHTSKGLDLVLSVPPGVHDGRYANNGWLQELPDPVTKVTWSNPVAVSAADASRLGIEDGDVVAVQAGGRSVEAPVIVQRGQAPGVVSAFLGYGRDALSVARGVGVNFFPLLDATTPTPMFRAGVEIIPTGKRITLPLTQTHHEMEGRDIARILTARQYAAGETGGPPAHELPSLYPEQHFGPQKWGMAIDLAACVGCAGCTVACQSENNIPVVGPEQVLKGREMHWMRIDRYYEEGTRSPRVVHQPMLCQQCDNAPCENVCPVNATNHSPDGLNQMVYNRCVGTRYCANNCPYKVRRFNFFDFTGAKTEPESLVYNPEVTVRPRGVMEKCTFCVQRIQDARQRTKSEQRQLGDGEIQPACAATCPTDAIVFGNLNDPNSAVSRLTGNDRGYHVLAELGVRPAVTYLAKITNPADGGGDHAV